MEHHQRNRAGNSKIINYLTDHFQVPKDFPSLVYVTQVLQAEAMRIAVEHWRRNRARCSGTLYWQLNDCWPVASWSSIDYYGRWKALHYAARRFYDPILLSIQDEGRTWAYSSPMTSPKHGRVMWCGPWNHSGRRSAGIGPAGSDRRAAGDNFPPGPGFLCPSRCAQRP